jgi:hypothetical protein
MRPYLSIHSIYYNEAYYLREWIEFHRLVGVERFFLYNNFSTDDHRAVLEPYVEAGTVVLHDWPVTPAQLPAFRDGLERHRDDSTWMAFIDIDEFLFSPTGSKVSALLRNYEEFPGVGINRIDFGTSGHEVRQPGLAIENYVRRSALDRPRNLHIKSVVQPSLVKERAGNPHFFRYLDGRKAVNEQREPIKGDATGVVSCEVFRINHYITRSQEERNAKLSGPDVLRGTRRNVKGASERDKILNAELDEAILRYAPALREALALSS